MAKQPTTTETTKMKLTPWQVAALELAVQTHAENGAAADWALLRALLARAKGVELTV